MTESNPCPLKQQVCWAETRADGRQVSLVFFPSSFSVSFSSFLYRTGRGRAAVWCLPSSPPGCVLRHSLLYAIVGRESSGRDNACWGEGLLPALLRAVVGAEGSCKEALLWPVVAEISLLKGSDPAPLGKPPPPQCVSTFSTRRQASRVLFFASADKARTSWRFKGRGLSVRVAPAGGHAVK